MQRTLPQIQSCNLVAVKQLLLFIDFSVLISIFKKIQTMNLVALTNVASIYYFNT